MNSLRVCAGCSGWFLGPSSATYPPPAFWCPKCADVHQPYGGPSFDPQPGDQVRPSERPDGGAFAELLVIARDADSVTVQPLGFPDRRHVRDVRTLVPGAGR